MDMDLSKLLSDVYDRSETPAAEPQPKPARPPRFAAPAWADDDRLDKVFADWTPGPPPEAPAAEREIAMGASMGFGSAAPAETAVVDDDLAAALSAALVEAEQASEPSHVEPLDLEPPHVEPAVLATEPAVAAPVDVPGAVLEVPVAEPAPVVGEPAVVMTWRRGDDDVLPGGSRSGRGVSFLRRR